MRLLPSKETRSLGGGSLSVIVPTPVPSAIVALVGLKRLTSNVSASSSSTSSVIDTSIVVDVAPALIVRLPLTVV